jgi:hypothetical protein
MANQRVIRLREPPRVTVTLAEVDLDDIIQCIASAADRAERATYELSSTPRAKAIAKERAKHLYALAERLDNARMRRK